MSSTPLVLAAAMGAAAAAALLVQPRRSAGPRRVVRPRPGRWLMAVAGTGFAVAVAAGSQGRHLGLLVVLSVAGIGGLRHLERAGQERLAQDRRVLVVDYCEALVGELRAGQPVTKAVERSSEVWTEAGSVSAAAALGASVPGALRRLAELPGAAAVRRLAGAWEISASAGGGLVLAVEQVLTSARAEEATARLVRAELASARATARLVTGLPVVVLLAAQGVGARPWHFLLDTGAGVACLAGGVVLALVGLEWIDRIGRSSMEAGR